MTTLFHAELSARDFSSYVVHVGDLLEWTKSKRLHLRTTPPVEGYEFVQVEALLCAIERHAGDVTTDQALNIVLNHPVLKNDPVVTRYPDDVDPTLCRWLLGAEAHRKWRELLSGAIAANELALLDFGSKLPIAEPAPMVTNQTEAVDPASDGPAPLTTGDIAHCFAGLRWDESRWKKPLGDKPKWLDGCMVIPGQKGVSERRWNPVFIGAALVQQGHVKARNVRAKFQTVDLLRPWLDVWKTYEADNFDSE